MVIGIIEAFSGSIFLITRQIIDRYKRKERLFVVTLQLKLTGTMLLILLMDSVGYLIAIQYVAKHEAGTAIAINISNAARRLANETIADFSNALNALGRGDFERANVNINIEMVLIHSNDEIGQMAESFNSLQMQIVHSINGLKQARQELIQAYDGLSKANIKLSKANEELEQRVEDRTQTLSLTNKELTNALENLQVAQTQLVQSEKMSSIGVLTAGIAHEINNPVNFILASINPLKKDIEELLKIMDLYSKSHTHPNVKESLSEIEAITKKLNLTYINEEIQNLLQCMKEGALRIGEIVKALRTFSRIDETKFKRAQINECIESTLQLLVYEVEKKIKVAKDLGDLPEIECQPGKINQVLMNVLMNAIQAIKEKGLDENSEIKITTRSEGDKVRIHIRDNGNGIKSANVNKIFEPFFSTKEIGSGTGLGLSISYGIIHQHQGEITVRSQEGEYTEFVILLPVTGDQKTL